MFGKTTRKAKNSIWKRTVAHTAYSSLLVLGAYAVYGSTGYSSTPQQHAAPPRPAVPARPATTPKPATPTRPTTTQPASRPNTTAPRTNATTTPRTTTHPNTTAPSTNRPAGTSSGNTASSTTHSAAASSATNHSGSNSNHSSANTSSGSHDSAGKGGDAGHQTESKNRESGEGVSRATKQTGGFGSKAELGKPTVTKSNGGGTHEVYKGGVQVDKAKGGAPTHYVDKNHGIEAKRFDASGRPTQLTHVTAAGRTSIQRVGNSRRIETTRTVHGGVEHVVSYGHGGGFVQRPIVGRAGYVQRTVIRGGRSYGVVYHSYYYGHVMLYSPAPAIIFAPAYYGYLLNPWPQPIVYGAYWGWAGQPWYGYYGAAFTPYPRYYSADQWLTDYLIAQNLQAAYDEQVAAGGAPSGPPPPITDEEKALIAQDVHAEIQRQQQQSTQPQDNPGAGGGIVGDNNAPPPEAPNQVPEALQDHIFTVYAAPLQVETATGNSCNLTAGDMLFRTGNAPNSDDTVDVEVKSGHGDKNHTDLCAPEVHAKVQLADLQEMYNHKRELLAEGEQQQSDLVGKKHGLPKGPKANATQVAQNKIDPDTQAAVDALKQQLKDADDTENQVSLVTTTSGS